MFLGWFLGCLVVVCGGCFLFFGVCRGFCFVGVVVFGVSFLFGRCGSIVCFCVGLGFFVGGGFVFSVRVLVLLFCIGVGRGWCVVGVYSVDAMCWGFSGVKVPLVSVGCSQFPGVLCCVVLDHCGAGVHVS